MTNLSGGKHRRPEQIPSTYGMKQVEVKQKEPGATRSCVLFQHFQLQHMGEREKDEGQLRIQLRDYWCG